MRFLEFLMLSEQDVVALQNQITQGEVELNRIKADATRKSQPLEKKVAGLKRQLAVAQQTQAQQQGQQNAPPRNNQPPQQ